MPEIRKKKKVEVFSHPELLLGEVLLNYFTPDRFDRLESLPSKRMGEMTYDIMGNKIPGTNYCPVFVSEADYEKYQKKISDKMAKIEEIKKRQKRN